MEPVHTQIHMVTPRDTNQHGTIFGGKVMELADTTAAICARRVAGMPVLTAALDRIDFINPIYMGEEAHLTPRLLCTYRSSMQIEVEVKAVDPFSGKERLTAKTLFTYVAIDKDTMKSTPLPKSKTASWMDTDDFRKSRENRKVIKSTRPKVLPKKPVFSGEKPGRRVKDSWVENHHLVLPGDHDSLDLLFAGRYLAWVDIAGALSARRHCRKPVVTAAIEEVEFKIRVPRGSTLGLSARPIFSAKSSVQVQVTGWIWNDEYEPQTKIAEAFLTFVALDLDTGKTASVPRLILSNALERKAYLLAQGRYLDRKKLDR